MGVDFCARAVADGHEVRLFREGGARAGEGFAGIKLVDNWKPSVAWAGKDGLVFPTGNSKYTRDLDRFKDFGVNVFGPSEASAALEIDRQKGMEAMQAAGIDVPPYECFSTLDEAEKYARKSDMAYVFKPMGSEGDKALTFVASSPAEMVAWIQRQKARGMVLKGKCMLQERIDMLSEIGVSGWFGPDGFLPGRWQICFEHKKLMSGDFGPSTGEMGTVCQYVETDKLAEQMLVPMEPILKALGHRGDFAVGAGIDRSGKAFPFEWTARAGWPAWFLQTASHKGDVAQWMLDLLRGKDSLRVSHETAIGVVMAQPRFPYGGAPKEMIEGNPITGMEDAGDDIHPVQIMIAKGPVMEGGKVVTQPTFQTSGEYVAVATGLGSTVSKARERVYETVDKVCFSNRIVRDDIGECLEKQLPALHKLGFAKAIEYG